MAKYVVQMLYRDAMGEFWDDVTREFDTRGAALEALREREQWCLDDEDYDTELRIHCYRAPRPPREPKPVMPRRLIEPAARVAAPILRKRA